MLLQTALSTSSEHLFSNWNGLNEVLSWSVNAFKDVIGLVGVVLWEGDFHAAGVGLLAVTGLGTALDWLGVSFKVSVVLPLIEVWESLLQIKSDINIIGITVKKSI